MTENPESAIRVEFTSANNTDEPTAGRNLPGAPRQGSVKLTVSVVSQDDPEALRMQGTVNFAASRREEALRRLDQFIK